MVAISTTAIIKMWSMNMKLALTISAILWLACTSPDGDRTARTVDSEASTEDVVASEVLVDTDNSRPDTSVTIDRIDTTDTSGDDVASSFDSAGTRPDVLASESDASGRPQHKSEPSGQPCLCWPTGESCELGTTDDVHDEAYRCPVSEFCWGNPTPFPNPIYATCNQACFHPDADHFIEMDCADGWECQVVTISWGLEDRFKTTQAMCARAYPNP